MERFVERALSERLARSGGATSESIGLLGAIERAGAGLNERQRQAVQMALSSSVSVLCGSAGTGKTTTLRAILAAARAGFGADYTVYQVALAGRAAKRMAEATGAEAVTVYRFLRDERLRQRRAELGLLIVDEASMLDLPAVYSLLRAIPASTNLLFVGDPSQLPPIGPGLVFHRMVASRRIPRVELTAIHRHAANSGIPLVGAAIRGGRFPRLPTYDLNEPEQPGVFIHRAESDHVATATVRVLEALAGAPLATGVRQRDIQILCATRRGPAGAVALNEMIERKHIAGGARNARWGLAIGSKILWAVNDHHRGSRAAPRSLLNGTLGIVAEVNDEGLVVHFDDGTSDVLRREDLTKVERGWAVSVHKAQGSAFGHVLMPVTPSRLLDRNLVYTAVTRAVRSVVLIGDELLLRAAVKEVTHTMTRRVGLNLGGDSASSGMASTTI
jgi:exodeoxyribonuclease V alpha subunit